MMELSAIKQKLDMIEPDIQKKRLNSNLLKMFNVTLPCGDSCPSELARNFDCEFDNFGSETRKLKLTFESAVINKNNTIYKADPFRLNEYNGSHYCTKTYVGPKYVFWRDSMICPFEQDDIENTDSTILNPDDHDCFQSNNNDLKDYWKTGNCVENLKKIDIQVKISKEELYIYCFNENITVFGITKACPIYPFRLGRDVSFKIGKRSYDARSFRMTVNTYETLKINLMLDSGVGDFNLKPVSVNLTTVDFIPNLRGTSSEPLYIQIVIGILIIILLVCVYCLCRSEKPKYHRYLQPGPKNVDNSLI
ncbi:uncharacterized protein LOC107363116 [Tetranychus urticae]|nr:uncharacterized protein LOC107363116 [Tetranychus urticae]